MLRVASDKNGLTLGREVLNSGWWRVASWYGVPIRLHWTLPLGMFVFGGLKVNPAFWLAFFVIVLAHELGHAWWVRRFGHQVHRIDITGFGGACVWAEGASSRASEVQRSMIAWGGVQAQFGIFVLAMILSIVTGGAFARTSVGYAFTVVNALLILINLLPLPSFDGAEAWKLFSRLKRDGGWPKTPATGPCRRARRVRGPATAGAPRGAKFKPRFLWFRNRGDQAAPSEGEASAESGTQMETGGQKPRRRGKRRRPSAAPAQGRPELARLFEQVAEDARRAKEGS